MSVPRLTLRNVEIRAVSIPLKRPVVSRVGRFDRWPLVLIDLQTEEGMVGRSYLEPYLERSVGYIVPVISDLAEARKGRPIAPLDDFRTGRAGLNLIGLEGVSMIAVSGLDMAAWTRWRKPRTCPWQSFSEARWHLFPPTTAMAYG
jgi:mandelate racemase